jgi:hypothetical protein
MSRCKCQKPPDKSIESSTEEKEQPASQPARETNRVAQQMRRKENEGQKESRKSTTANEGRRDWELGINDEDREVKVLKRWGTLGRLVRSQNVRTRTK